MIGKNILYVPQLSMYNKQNKKFIPQADGNVNMLRNTVNEWLKHKPNDKFYVLLPHEKEFSYSNINKLKLNIRPLYYDNYVVSARINRFNFPMNEISSLLKINNEKIDLIICDVIELVGNIKQMFKVELEYEPKIISNIRHIDDNINHSYMYRVIDGIMQSDLTTILSESMKGKLYEQIEDLTNYNLAKMLMDEIYIYEPSISKAEIDKFNNNAIKKEIDKVIITFPGRLSVGEENRTNWDKFQDAILNLRKKRQDFEVYLTDPNNSITNELKNNLKDWIKTIEKDRSQFLNLLHKTDIIVSLMAVEGFGGISIREALLSNCLPIIPYIHEYKKMAPNENYLGYIYPNPNSSIDSFYIEDALEWAIIKIKQKKVIYNYMQYGIQFTVEEQFKNLLPKIEELLK